MLGDGHLHPKGVSYFKSNTSTRTEFLNAIEEYLENHDIGLIGPFTIRMQQQPENARTRDQRLILSLTGELRPGSPSHLHHECYSDTLASDCFMGAGTEHFNSLLDEPQSLKNLSQPGAPSPDQAPPLPWDPENNDFSSTPHPAGLQSLYSDGFPNAPPAALEDIHENNEGSAYNPTYDILMRDSGAMYESHPTGERASASLPTSLARSQVNTYVGCSGTPARTAESYLDEPKLQSSNFVALEGFAQGASPATSSPSTMYSRGSTPSTQTSLASETQPDTQPHQQVPNRGPRFHQPPLTRDKAASATGPLANVVIQKVLRDDCLQFLENELPRWAREPLWNDARALESTAGTSAFRGLELAYSFICQLDVRMSDDAIRNRMGLIRLHLEYSEACERQTGNHRARTIGRGDASFIIDAILKSTHLGWEGMDDKSKSALRVRFHDRKRYGKRWSLLTDALGLGILLLCAPKMANMVHNTTITVKRLETIIRDVKAKDATTMKILQIINPVARSLLQNGRDPCYEGDEIITQLRDITPTGLATEDMHRVP